MRARPGLWQAGPVRLRCVIVDDSGAFLDAARTLLEREGLTVAGVASTTAEALRQVRALRPDVVLTDIALGDESGFSLAGELAADGRGDSSVILISASAEADYGDLIACSDAIGFIPKEQLSARRIRQLLGQTGQARRIKRVSR
jgi:two-component system, NarL family, nitrate/nitrite response regulator NarL